jgi:hypothetical protein
MHEQEPIKVGIQINEDGRAEWMFAEPAGPTARDGSGTYRLLNTAFYSPFVLHDIVEVKRKQRGLYVTGLREASRCSAYDVTFSPDVTVKEMLDITDEWLNADAFVGRCDDDVFVLTVLPEGGRPTEDELEELVEQGLLNFTPIRHAQHDLASWPPVPAAAR